MADAQRDRHRCSEREVVHQIALGRRSGVRADLPASIADVFEARIAERDLAEQVRPPLSRPDESDPGVAGIAHVADVEGAVRIESAFRRVDAAREEPFEQSFRELNRPGVVEVVVAPIQRDRDRVGGERIEEQLAVDVVETGRGLTAERGETPAAARAAAARPSEGRVVVVQVEDLVVERALKRAADGQESGALVVEERGLEHAVEAQQSHADAAGRAVEAPALAGDLHHAGECAAVLRFEPALAELPGVDRVHVERAEVPEQMVHVVDAEPVVLDAILVRRAAADVEAGGRLVAAGDAGQELKRAKEVALAQAGQHRDLRRGERDAADGVAGVEHRHFGDDRHVGRERRRQREVDLRGERAGDLERGVVALEVGQFREEDEPARRTCERQRVVAVAVRGGDQWGSEDSDGGAWKARSVRRLHGAGDAHVMLRVAPGALCDCVVYDAGRAQRDQDSKCESKHQRTPPENASTAAVLHACSGGRRVGGRRWQRNNLPSPGDIDLRHAGFLPRWRNA